MRYENDAAGVRDAQNNLKNAQDEQRIATLQKEVDLIQKVIDGINDQKEKIEEQKKAYNDQIKILEKEQKQIQLQTEDLQEQEEILQKQQKAYQKQQKELQKQQKVLQKQQEEYQEKQAELQKQQEEIRKEMEAVTKNYEKLIKEQTKMFDDLIAKLEETKSKWEELAEVEAVAKAWGLVADEMARLGLTVEDVINDTPGAFEAFKGAYMDAIAAMHSKDEGFLQGMKNIYGYQVPAAVKQTTDAIDGTKTAIEGSQAALQTVGGAAKDAYGVVQTSADGAAGKVMTLGTKADETKNSLEGMNGVELSNLASTLENVATNLKEIEGINLETLNTALNDMHEAVATEDFNNFAMAFLAIQNVTLSALAGDLERMKASVDETTTSNVESIKTSFEGMSTANISQLVTDFTTLQGLLPTITEALLGSGTEADTGIIGALKAMEEINLEEGIIEQFNMLNDSIVAVTNSLDGSGGEGSGGEEGEGGSEKRQGGGEEEGGNMVAALEHVKETADTTIGLDPEEEADTVIGHFNALGTSIEKVTKEKIGLEGEDAEGTLKKALEDTKQTADDKIGTSDSDTGDTIIGDVNKLGKAAETVAKTKIGLGNESDNSTLNSTFKKLKDAAEENIPKVVDQFEALKKAIGDCIEKMQKLLDKIAELPDGFSFDYTGTANPKAFTGTAFASGTAKSGPAKLSGDWRVGKNETALVGEIGPELVVDSSKGRYRLVGENGPEFTKLHPSDIVFNHLQTKEILDKKNHVGPAFAAGTIPDGFVPLDDNGRFDKLKEAIKDATLPVIDGIKGIIQEQTSAVQAGIKNITNNSSTTTTVNQNNTFNISGVSGEDVARQINTTLVNTFSGMSIKAYQRSMA